MISNIDTKEDLSQIHYIKNFNDKDNKLFRHNKYSIF